MKVGEICTRRVILVREGVSVREAAREMRRCHVGSLVVVDKPDGGPVPIGIITDRDIVLAVVAAAADSERIRVGDVMSRDVATCFEDDSLFDAVQTMRRRGVRRLPVLHRKQGSLIGVVTADDIYGVIGTHMAELSRALKHEQANEVEARV